MASELQYKNFDWEHKSEKIKNREVSMSNSEKIKMEEKNESSSFEVTTSNVRGVTFPMSDETKQKLGELKDGKIEILVVVSAFLAHFRKLKRKLFKLNVLESVTLNL